MEYLIFLRILHIVSAVFWAGATIYLAFFVIPAVKALGPDGSKFMAQLSKTNRLPLVMNITATLTVVAGILMIEYLSNGFQMAWFGSPFGIVLSTGGTLALIAYIVGFAVSLPTILQMNKIGKVIAESKMPASPEQSNELQKLRTKLFSATNIIAILLLLTSICMSVARYF